MSTATTTSPLVTIRTYLFQAASDYNSKKDTITLTAAGDTDIALDNIVVDGEDFDIKSFKSDDYILVTASTDGKSNKYTVQSVDAAEVVSGEVTGYKLDNSATIGGTEYNYSSTTKEGSGKVRSTTYTVGQNARVVLDKYGYVIAVDEAVVASNYVYVSEFAQPSGLSSGKVVASAYFTDGTTADITIKDRYGSSNKAALGLTGGVTVSASAAGWYTYSKNSANEYSLYAAEAKYTEAGNKSGVIKQDYTSGSGLDVMYNGKVAFLPQSSGVMANDNTIVIVDDGNDVTVYTGVKNIPDITLKAGANGGAAGSISGKFLANKSGYAGYVFVKVSGNATISGNEDSKLVYYVKYDGQFKTTDNKVYFTYKVLDENGKEEVVKFDAQSNGSGDIYKVYNKTRVNGDDEITSVSEVTEGGKYIAGTSASNAALTYTDGALTLNQSGTNKGYTLADNAKITLVTLQSAKEINKDKAASYEVAVGLTGKALGDLLKDYALSYSYAGKVTDTNGSIIEELFVTVTAATFTKTPAPVVSGTYQLSADTISKAANSKIKVDGMVQEKVSGTWTNVAAADVKVTYTVQTWNTSTGTWNVAKTYLVDVGPVSAGTAIGATLNLPVPTNSPVLVSAVVETSVGTFMLGEQVVTV